MRPAARWGESRALRHIRLETDLLYRPTVVMFENGIPSKAHCSCPVGLSVICCHALALLFSLKHYHETGERIQKRQSFNVNIYKKKKKKKTKQYFKLQTFVGVVTLRK